MMFTVEVEGKVLNKRFKNSTFAKQHTKRAHKQLLQKYFLALFKAKDIPKD